MGSNEEIMFFMTKSGITFPVCLARSSRRRLSTVSSTEKSIVIVQIDLTTKIFKTEADIPNAQPIPQRYAIPTENADIKRILLLVY